MEYPRRFYDDELTHPLQIDLIFPNIKNLTRTIFRINFGLSTLYTCHTYHHCVGVILEITQNGLQSNM